MIVNPRYGSIEIETLSSRYTAADILRMLPATEAIMVTVKPTYAPSRGRGLLTCVSVVKAVLGLGGRSFTPWQFRCELKAIEDEATETEDRESVS